MDNRQSTVGYVVGLCASICVFAFINYVHFHRPVTCWDCHFPYGLPFTLYQAGGFGGDSGFVWTGIIGDFVVVAAAGMGLGWTWTKISAAVRTKL